MNVQIEYESSITPIQLWNQGRSERSNRHWKSTLVSKADLPSLKTRVHILDADKVKTVSANLI